MEFNNQLVLITGDCAGCEAISPVAAEVAEEHNLEFVRIEAENCRGLIKEQQVEKLPATILYRDGKAVCKCYGYQPKEILEIYIEEYLK